MFVYFRLSEVVCRADSARGGVHFADTDTLPCIGKGVKKCDIYRLGIVLLSLAKGAIVQDNLADCPSHLPAEFRDFIEKCLMQDERQRWSADQLLEHTFVKLQISAIRPRHKDNRKLRMDEQGACEKRVQLRILYILFCSV